MAMAKSGDQGEVGATRDATDGVLALADRLVAEFGPGMMAALSRRLSDDRGESGATRELDGSFLALADRLAAALGPERFTRLSSRLAHGRSERVVDWAGVDPAVMDWALRAGLEPLVSAATVGADRAEWPESAAWEGRCARCRGLGRFGIERVSRRASVQWERKPAECLDPDACRWPYGPDA
jgi:hypothetical protein